MDGILEITTAPDEAVANFCDFLLGSRSDGVFPTSDRRNGAGEKIRGIKGGENHHQGGSQNCRGPGSYRSAPRRLTTRNRFKPTDADAGTHTPSAYALGDT